MRNSIEIPFVKGKLLGRPEGLHVYTSELQPDRYLKVRSIIRFSEDIYEDKTLIAKGLNATALEAVANRRDVDVVVEVAKQYEQELEQLKQLGIQVAEHAYSIGNDQFDEEALIIVSKEVPGEDLDKAWDADRQELEISRFPSAAWRNYSSILGKLLEYYNATTLKSGLVLIDLVHQGQWVVDGYDQHLTLVDIDPDQMTYYEPGISNDYLTAEMRTLRQYLEFLHRSGFAGETMLEQADQIIKRTK